MPRLLLVFTLLLTTLGSAQNELNETERLVTFGKLYGFLKYYHPNVAQGQFDWDQEFLKTLPKVLEETDSAALSELYLSWINDLGQYESCDSCNESSDSFDKNFDLNWLNNPLFTTELQTKLNHIRQNRAQNGNHYATAGPAGKVEITNEPQYPDLGYPDKSHRLLALFKYWNIIEYFYPYKYLNETPWDTVLLTMIPEFSSAGNLQEYELAIKRLVAQIDDSHVWIRLDDQKKSKYLPVRVTNIDQQLVISGYYSASLAAANNLKKGDVISHINGEPVANSVTQLIPFLAGSNENHKRIRAYYELLNDGEGTLQLSIQRGSQTLEITAERYSFDDFDYRNSTENPSYLNIDDQVGYINMISLGGKEIGKIFKEFKEKKAIIIDVRNYPTQTLYRTTNFLNKEEQIFAGIYKPNFNYPGKFLFTPGPKTHSSNRAFDGLVIVLVNEESISWSEFTIMALQTAPNVITVGSQTAGADGNVVIFEFMGGYRTAMSGLGIMYPDGQESQRQGVKIDFLVEPTISGLQEGRDEVLEKALDLARQN